VILRLLTFLALGFKIWMFTDATRRRVPQWWYWVIWLPFGAVAYFLMVKSRDYRGSPLGRFLRAERAPTIDQLRARYENSPSLANLLDLARAQHDGGLHEDASETFQRALESADDELDAHYGRALCRLALEDWTGAIAHLEQVVAQEPAFEQYDAWAQLAYARHCSGDGDGCLSELGRLVETSPRLQHQLYLAHYLREAGREVEARDVLTEGLSHHENAPPFIRKHNRIWARQARAMLKQLSESSTSSGPTDLEQRNQ